MKITRVDIIPYRIPNREVHHIATLTLTALENVIVRIRTDDGVEGVGECVTEAKWNSTVMEAHAAILEKYLAPAIIGADPFSIRDVWRRMDGVVNGQLPAKGAVDIALHDLIGRALGIPVWRYLGGTDAPVIVEGPGYGIGFMSPERAVDMAVRGVADGCRQIEIKCGHPAGPAHDLAVVEAVHKALGPAVSLKIDCTEGYTFKDALNALPRFAAAGVDWVEQPLPRHELQGLAELRRRTPNKLALEESIGGPQDILTVAAMGAADGIHVKLAMLGGISKCREIAQICAAAALEVLPGCSTASGIGLAAAHHFAASIDAARGCHASPLARAIDDILVDPLPPHPAEVRLTEAPGLGIAVDWDKVKKYAA
ncbi:MAG: mandelate racemase/muconate lactonizing enzyme family protein [Alphaproteobacteria bacterium]|nr:mandelate racemase/muconate lactonizing enzyme family protein [Alphaproteobacteria bacterium]